MKETPNGYRADNDSVVIYDKSWDWRRVHRLWTCCGWCGKVSSGSFNNALLPLLTAVITTVVPISHALCFRRWRNGRDRIISGSLFTYFFIYRKARAKKKKKEKNAITRPYIGTSLSHWLHCAWRFNALCHGNVRETRKPLFAANSRFSSSGCDDKMT